MESTFGTSSVAAILQAAYDNNQIWIGPFGDNIPSGVQAQNTGTNGVIQIASNRAFVTGILADGTAITQAEGFKGLSFSQADELILLHELLHFTGSVGSDNASQKITMPNGDVVIGSAGVTAEVREHCLHH